MPVLVAARPSALATGVIRRILVEGGEVRAYGPGAGVHRGTGAIVASGDLDDEGRMEAAMAQVHTVVHIPRGVLAAGTGGLVAEAETVATAATNAGVRRLLTLTLPGAGATAEDPLRRAHGAALEALAAAPVPSVALVPSLVDTPVLRDVLAGVTLGAAADTTVAPVRLADLVELVAAFDAVRSEAHAGHVVFAAMGPRVSTLAEHLERVGVGRSRLGRAYRPLDAHPDLLDALAGPWVDATVGAFDAWEFTGVTPRPVA